jgi:phospholipid transport system substrate-binding protein
MKIIRQLSLVSLLALIPIIAFSAPPEPSETPTRIVENLHATLLGVMKDAKKTGYADRYKRLAPVIKKTFDLPFIARIVVGRYWWTFTNDQKTKFVKAFERLSIATYAHRFAGFSGEKFQLVSEKKSRQGRMTVKSLLIKSDGEKVELDYTLSGHNKQWRVINVTANGISDLSLKRSDYTAFLKKKGVDALIDKLDEKISSYSGK